MMNAQSNLVFNEKPVWHDCDYLITNERASYIIENGNKSIYVTQIADKWVKKIVTFRDNEEVNQGEIFGLIRMGSQVDIFIPDNGKMKINVKERQHVKAGLTCLISEEVM
jgi:phosphatidylserine decarboxylase